MIRRARLEDAEGIARVHVRSWQASYTHVFPADRLANLSVRRRVQLWSDFLPRSDVGIFVTESNDAISGFVSVGPSPDAAGDGELYAIYVDPDRWGSGDGRDLIDAGEEWLRLHDYERATLWVLDDNPRARRFYEAAGWTADGSERTGQHLGVPTREVRYAKPR
ncbi:MAG: GNAT family N-acetyltransferase [Gaiellaceae bacterium]